MYVIYDFMYVCNVCVYVCNVWFDMYVCINMILCMYMYVCYVCMYVMHVCNVCNVYNKSMQCMCVYIYIWIDGWTDVCHCVSVCSVYMYICNVCMYVHMYLCMCVYIPTCFIHYYWQISTWGDFSLQRNQWVTSSCHPGPTPQRSSSTNTDRPSWVVVRWVVGSILHGRLIELFLIPASAPWLVAARCSSVVRAFAHGAMGCQIDPSWGGPIELFLVPASAPRLV